MLSKEEIVKKIIKKRKSEAEQIKDENSRATSSQGKREQLKRQAKEKKKRFIYRFTKTKSRK